MFGNIQFQAAIAVICVSVALPVIGMALILDSDHRYGLRRLAQIAIGMLAIIAGPVILLCSLGTIIP